MKLGLVTWWAQFLLCGESVSILVPLASSQNHTKWGGGGWSQICLPRIIKALMMVHVFARIFIHWGMPLWTTLWPSFVSWDRLSSRLFKLDLKDAYRIVPVHPLDHSLLGISWKMISMSIERYPLGCGQPRRFSLLWQMLLPSASTAPPAITLPWWLLVFLATLGKRRLMRCWLWYCIPSTSLGSRCQLIRLKDQLCECHFWGFRLTPREWSSACPATNWTAYKL